MHSHKDRKSDYSSWVLACSIISRLEELNRLIARERKEIIEQINFLLESIPLDLWPLISWGTERRGYKYEDGSGIYTVITRIRKSGGIFFLPNGERLTENQITAENQELVLIATPRGIIKPDFVLVEQYLFSQIRLQNIPFFPGTLVEIEKIGNLAPIVMAIRDSLKIE